MAASTTPSDVHPGGPSPIRRIIGPYLLLSGALIVYLLLNDHQMFRENIELIIRCVFCVVTGLYWSLLAGLVLIPLGAVVYGKRAQNAPAITVFLKAAACLIVVGGFVVRLLSPPSASSYFEKVFGSPLPASAHSIRVRGATYNDPNVLYFFSCTARDTHALVAGLRMTESTPSSEIDPDNLPIWPSPPSWPEYRTWQMPRLFDRRNGATGRVDYLMSDASETQVYVYKDPLGDKTDDELGLEGPPHSAF